MNHLSPQIRIALRGFIYRRRIAAILHALALTIGFSLLWIAIWAVVDRFVGFSNAMREVLLVFLVAIVVLLLIRPTRAIFRRQIDWQLASRQFERRAPEFAGLLSTVVSLTYDDRTNASQSIADEMRREVEARLKTTDFAQLVSWTPVIRAWLTLFAALIVTSLVALVPTLDLPRLIARQLDPISRIPPATTTQISMVSGNLEVAQGSSVSIQAQVRSAGGGNVFIRTMTDGQDWVSSGMNPNPDGTWTRSLSSLNRDMTYEIRAGDAVAGPYRIRVQQPPITREIKVRLTYPRYIAKSPLDINRAKGVLEAPIGTAVQLTVVATEPLRTAWFIVNGQRLIGRAGSDPQTRTAELALTEDANVSVEMISERGVRGRSLEGLVIHSIRDNPPIVHMVKSPGFLILGAKQSDWIAYQASDDYGMATLEARFDVQGQIVGRRAFLMADLRQVNGEFTIDPSSLNVKPGQIVNVNLIAKDLADQTTMASPIHILVTSDPVDTEGNRRVSDMHAAARLAATAHGDMVLARRILDSYTEGDPIVVRQRSMAKIASACEASGLLVRTLIRVGIDARHEDVSRAIAALADSSQSQASALEHAGSGGFEESVELLQKRLTEMESRAAELERQTALLWRGTEADLILAQRRGLKAAALNDSPDSNHLREELDARILTFGLEPRALDLDLQLQARVDAAREFEHAALPVDLTHVAMQWFASADKVAMALPQRLSVAAQCEAMRADGDIPFARDLELSSRAIRLAASPANSARLSAQSLNEISAAVQVLLKREPRSTASAIAAARDSLIGFAGESAASLAKRSEMGKQDSSKPVLGGEDASRDAAFEIVRRWQQFLAELPQRLAMIEQAASACIQSRTRLEETIRESESGPPEDQPVAQSAVEAMRTMNEESFRSLATSSESLDPAQAIAMARELRATGTEGYIAAVPIEQQLVTSLTNLRNAVQKRDPGEIQRLAPGIRAAASASQQSLHDARQQLVERDPAVAAKWFAQRSPAATRPSIRSSRADSAPSFQSTWDDPIERLFRARLAGENFGASVPRTFINTEPGEGDDLDRSWNAYLENASKEPEPEVYKDALDAYFQKLADR